MGKIKTDDPIYLLHEHGIDTENNIIFLYGEAIYVEPGTDDTEEPGVEYVMTNRFLKNLHFLMKQGSDKPILIDMKTNGGDWHEGMAIYDAIKACPNPIVILNRTHARSMSSIILQAATKRVMMPHSYFMFHEGELGISGTEKQVRSYIKFSKADTEVMLDIYTAKMKRKGKYKNQPKKKIRRMLQDFMNKKEDVYISSKEAVEWGLADSVFDSNWNKLVTEGVCREQNAKTISKNAARSKRKAKKRNRRIKGKA